MNSTLWTTRASCAHMLKDMATVAWKPLAPYVPQLFQVLCQTIPGRVWDGKEHTLVAISLLVVSLVRTAVDIWNGEVFVADELNQPMQDTIYSEEESEEKESEGKDLDEKNQDENEVSSIHETNTSQEAQQKVAKPIAILSSLSKNDLIVDCRSMYSDLFMILKA